MLNRIISYILNSRLENVMALGVSGILLTLYISTGTVKTLTVGMLNLFFIMLPAGLLGVKFLLARLLASPNDENAGSSPEEYLRNFLGPLAKIFRDWFPFFLLSACYYSLYSNLIMQVNPHTVDATLSRMDAVMFGQQAAILLEPWINPWITDFLSVVYFSHVLVFPCVALFFYLKKDTRSFRTLMMGYLTIMLMGITSYLVFPATGPEKFLAGQFTRDLDGRAVSHSVAYVITVGRVTYDCFPSLHVGIPLLIALYLKKYQPRLFPPAVVYVGMMCCATIYLRYHYVVDVIGSFIFAPVAYYLNNCLLQIWPGERIPAQTTILPINLKPNNIADAEPT